jgi:hypothetical protein
VRTWVPVSPNFDGDLTKPWAEFRKFTQMEGALRWRLAKAVQNTPVHLLKQAQCEGKIDAEGKPVKWPEMQKRAH